MVSADRFAMIDSEPGIPCNLSRTPSPGNECVPEFLSPRIAEKRSASAFPAREEGISADPVLMITDLCSDALFSDVSTAVTLIYATPGRASSGTIQSTDPLCPRSFPTGFQLFLPSVEYSTDTPATAELSDEDHRIFTADPGVTVEYEPGEMRVTEGGISSVSLVGSGVGVRVGTVVGVGVGVGVGTTAGSFVNALRQTFELG